MRYLGLRFWLFVAGLAALLAGTALAIGHREELRDGWRLARVRSQPGYGELRQRWRRIAVAAETRTWTDPGRSGDIRKLLGPRLSWEGPKELVALLENPATVLAEQDADRDFGDPRIQMKRERSAWQDRGGQAYAEVLALRSRGRLSDGTYERAMLALARHLYLPMHCQDAGCRRIGALVLCDLVGDRARPVRREPARNLEEALARVARTRPAAALAPVWKAILEERSQVCMVRCAKVVTVGGRTELIHRTPPPSEAQAFRCLAELLRATARLEARKPLDPGPRPVPRTWPTGQLPASAADALGCFRFTPEAAHDVVVAGLAREAARLPEDRRRAFYGLADMVVDSGGCDDWLGEYWSDAGEPRPDFAPTFRLIAEIIAASD